MCRNRFSPQALAGIFQVYSAEIIAAIALGGPQKILKDSPQESPEGSQKNFMGDSTPQMPESIPIAFLEHHNGNSSKNNKQIFNKLLDESQLLFIF